MVQTKTDNMEFELISKNYREFKKLCGKILFNPTIRSAIFDDDYKVVVKLEKKKLAEFAFLIRNLDVAVAEVS